MAATIGEAVICDTVVFHEKPHCGHCLTLHITPSPEGFSVPTSS